MDEIGSEFERPTGDPSPSDPGAGRVAASGADRGEPQRRRARGLAGPLALVALVVAIAMLGAAAGHEIWPGRVTAGGSGPGPFPFRFGPGGAGCARFGLAAPQACRVRPGPGAPSDVATIAAKVDPALVDITSTFGYASDVGAGTGIVLTRDGEILTNNHVIDGATRISVTDVGNGRTYRATVVGYDPAHDIAVLRLTGASGLATVELGDSARAAVGEAIVAIGNAGGSGGTPTSAGGSITALDQGITAVGDGPSEQLSGLIQVNADVVPGDSGGPLVDAAGRVLGMDTAATARFADDTAANQGYAIPIDAALATARAIVAGRGSTVVHVGPTAFLGVIVSVGAGRGDSPASDGAGPAAPSSSGALIDRVVGGEPAARVGLRGGDVITSVDGRSVSSAATLGSLLVEYHPGERVRLGWMDPAGKAQTAKVALASGPPA